MKKIDIHCHTSKRILQDTPSASASLETIAELMKQHDIEKTVLLATYFAHKSSGMSNFRLLNWIAGRNDFVMFGSLDFEHYFYQGFNELEELAQQKQIHGIKIYTCYQNIDLQGKKLKQVAELAQQYQLPLMFHCGYSSGAMQFANKPSIADMVSASDLEPLPKQYDVAFIICHLSKPYLNSVIELVKNNTNVYADMSGLINSKQEADEVPQCVEQVRQFVNECGPSRLLFGTDFPIQTHEHSIYFIEEGMKHFSEQDRKKVYYDNAAEVLAWNTMKM